MKNLWKIYKLASDTVSESGIKASAKYYADAFSEDELKEIASVDPTYNEEKPDFTGKYGRWLFDTAKRMKKAGSFSQEKLKQLGNDLKYANTNKLDFQKLKTFDELHDFVEKHKRENKNSSFSSKKAYENYKVFKKAESFGLKVLFDDEDWICGVPETFKSSREFGQSAGSRKISIWCTTQVKEYNEYSEDGSLFILMDKSTGDLYQCFWSDNLGTIAEIRNENNNPVEASVLPKNFKPAVEAYVRGKSEKKNAENAEKIKQYFKDAGTETTPQLKDLINANDVKEVVIPDGVEKITSGTFRDCSKLQEIDIPASVKEIGDDAFFNCRHLAKVNIHDVKAWAETKFAEHSSNPASYAKQLCLDGELIQELTVPEGVKSIEDYAFRNCFNIQTLHLPGSLEYIGDEAFSDCSKLQGELVVPDSVESIGREAFGMCIRLTKLKLGKNVSLVGKGAFHDCYRLVEAEVPGTLETISKNMFAMCTKLENVVLNEGTVKIEDRAFYNCGGLESVVLPSTIEEIGDNAFAYCLSLNSLVFKNKKSMDEIQAMDNYPWGIENPETVIKIDK